MVVEPPGELTGTLAERIKASVTVLEFVSQHVDLKLVCVNDFASIITPFPMPCTIATLSEPPESQCGAVPSLLPAVRPSCYL